MKLLMFGHSGQVAQEVLRRAGDIEVISLDRAGADLSDPASCAAALRAAEADAVLNAAAWTDVDGAESAEPAAAVVNAEAPGAMARAAAERGLPFIHISTDYVFDGAGERPFAEGDRSAPLGAYGRTKLDGERAIAAAGGAYAILRTSWVFSAHGKNFVKTMLRVGAGRDHLSVVDDQIGGPTPASAIAEACLKIAKTQAGGGGTSGIFHFSGAPETSWRGFAEAIFAEAGMKLRVDPIATADWPTPAKRPLNSRMDCSAIRKAYGVEQPDWRAALKDVVKEILT